MTGMVTASLDQPPDTGLRTRDLGTLVEGLRATLGARLRCVLAVGSLGRMTREGTDQVQVEDYDLIAVVSGTTALSRRLHRRRVDHWLRSLSDGLCVSASVGMLPVGRLPELPSTLFNYELKYGSLVLYGEDCTVSMPAYESAEIPVVEATRLLLNRGVLIWGASVALAADGSGAMQPQDWAGQYRKVLLALGDALLIREGLFHWSYRQRALNAVRCEGFERFAIAQLRDRYVTAIHGKRTGAVPLLPPTDAAGAIAELFALHQAVFRTVEEHRLGGGCSAWSGYAAAGVVFPGWITGSPAKRFARLVRCFGPPCGAGFYRHNAGRSDEEALTAAFPLLAYDGVRDRQVVGRLLNYPARGPLTALAVWERFHHVWAKGH